MAEEPTKKPARRTQQIGKYEILGHIATGGMGVIYKAHDVDLDRLVALKVLPADLAAQQTTLIRFQREAKAAAQLRHENIVSIFDVGESRGTYYIAFEFIEGVNLHDFIEKKTKLDPKEAHNILMQAARALAHAHDKGIVHRDIKPSNFLLTFKDAQLLVKLTDFGLAIRYENDAEFRITRDKTTVGTVDYMSPEQARDSRAVDTRSDIYSLGCTFFHMLTGGAPFAKGTLPERIVHHMQSPPPDLRRLNKNVPEYLVHITARMLAKRPDNRYQSAKELLFDLENPDKVTAPVKRTASINKSKRTAASKEETAAELEEATREEPVRAEPAGEDDSAVQVEVPTKRAPRAATEEVEAAPASDDSVEQDIVVEVVEQPKAPKAELPKKKSSQSSLLWLYATGAAMGVLGIVLVLAIMCGGRGPAKKDPEPPPVPPKVEPEAKEKPVIDEKPKETEIDTTPGLMTVPAPWPIMDTVLEKADPVALNKEFAGPFTAFPEAPAGATVLFVRRLAANDPGTYCTLGEALAATKAGMTTVIRIDDNGPLFVQNVPPLAKRSIFLRAGAGYRPLLVWDDPATVSAMCQLTDGSLVVDGIDIVARRFSLGLATLFQLPGSDFHARDCTFTLAGKTPLGFALVGRNAGTGHSPRTWLRKCFVRGPNLQLLNHDNCAASVLVDESLVVGHRHPLIQMRDAESLSLRSIRSTWVTGQVVVRCESKSATPALQAYVLDSILSRDDISTSFGDMIQLGNASPAKLSWQATNSVYAGWKNLLASKSQTIAGDDLASWRKLGAPANVERVLTETWPASPPPSVEDLAADALVPGRAVAFAAVSDAGAIGCAIGRLPAAPGAWQERGYEPRTAAIVAGASASAPPIPTARDGFYCGERLDLTKVDLGVHLARKLQMAKPAPRIVLHLTGRGVCQTSPVQIKGVQNLVLYFEPVKDFTLEANPTSALERAPLIDMTGGHLELIGAHIRLSNITLLPAIVQVHDSDLTVTRCRLEGPLQSDTFNQVIAVANTASRPVTVLLRDNIVVAGKSLLHLQDMVQLQARNNVFLGLDDGITFDVNRPIGALTHLFANNTFAIKRDHFIVKSGPEFQPTGAVRLYATSNAFLHPFAPNDGMLLRGAKEWAARGSWNWQGRNNIYDARLHAYFADKQTLRDWKAAWGQAGEWNPAQLEDGKTLDTDILTQAGLWQQLDRLALPTNLRGDASTGPPGADLAGLGILRK